MTENTTPSKKTATEPQTAPMSPAARLHSLADEARTFLAEYPDFAATYLSAMQQALLDAPVRSIAFNGDGERTWIEYGTREYPVPHLARVELSSVWNSARAVNPWSNEVTFDEEGTAEEADATIYMLANDLNPTLVRLPEGWTEAEPAPIMQPEPQEFEEAHGSEPVVMLPESDLKVIASAASKWVTELAVYIIPSAEESSRLDAQRYEAEREAIQAVLRRIDQTEGER